MPEYTFKCNSCEHQFEVIRSIKDESKEQCPICESECKQLVTGGAGFKFTPNRTNGVWDVGKFEKAQGYVKSDIEGWDQAGREKEEEQKLERQKIDEMIGALTPEVEKEIAGVALAKENNG